MKGRAFEGFGERLTWIRKSRAITQIDLGRKVGVSNRVIAYYENEKAQPPGPLLVDLARALLVSTDELLGVKPLKGKPDPKKTRLMNRLKKVEQLPPADQRAILKYIDALVERRGKGNGREASSGHG